MINKATIVCAVVLGMTLGLGNILGQMEAKARAKEEAIQHQDVQAIVKALQDQVKATKELTEVMQCNCGRR